MIEWLILVLNIIAGGLRVTVYLLFVYRLLLVEKPDKNSITVSLIGACVITVFFNLLQLPDLYRIVAELALIVFCACSFQKSDIRMSLFLGIFYEISISFWQFLVSVGIGIAFHSESFINSAAIERQVAILLSHLFLVVLALYVSKHADMDRRDAFRLVTVIVLAGFIAIIAFSQQTILVIPDDTLSTWIILAVVLMMSILVFNMNRQYTVEKELVRLKSEQSELLEQDFNALNNAYAVNAKLFHDSHNHIGALRQLLSHKKYNEAIEYLDELQEPIREIIDTIWTGNETVDYLINSKAVEAAIIQVQLQAHVEFPRYTNIRSADMCAILGNLLDNALEAVRKIPEPQRRFIRLTIRRINQMLVIKVENSFTDVPLIKENVKLETTKDDERLHGWGLKSAQTAAEKYDGMVKTSFKSNTFWAVATLSYQTISVKK